MGGITFDMVCWKEVAVHWISVKEPSDEIQMPVTGIE